MSNLIGHLQLAVAGARSPAEQELAESMLRRALHQKTHNPDFLIDGDNAGLKETVKWLYGAVHKLTKRVEELEEAKEDLEQKVSDLEGESDMTRAELERQVAALRDLHFETVDG